MKLKHLALIAAVFAASGSLMAHDEDEIEVSSNGGRLLEISGHENPHLEVILKDKNFVVGLYDVEAKKSLPWKEEVLEVTVGERSKPEAVKVTTENGKFIVPKPPGDDFWVIFQIKEKEGAKAKTVRLHFNGKKCPTCDDAEWLCKCDHDEDEKKDDKKK